MPPGANWRDRPPPHGALRAPLAEVVRFAPSAFAPLPAARVAVAIVVALGIGFGAGSSAAAATMAAGALLAGIPTVVTPRRPSIAGVLAVTAAMALSVFVGSVTGDLGWVHTAILIPWCGAAGLLMGQPAPATSVGSQAVAAMIVFGRFAEPPLGAAQLTGYVVAGSAIAIAVLGMTRAPLSGKDQRAALATVLDALATLATSQGGRRSGVAAAEAIEAAEGLLERQLGDLEQQQRLRSLLAVCGRIRLALLGIDGLERRLTRTNEQMSEPLRGALDAAVSRVGTALGRLGADLRAARAPQASAAGDAAFATDRSTLGLELAEMGGDPVRAALGEHLDALTGQLRAALDLTGSAIAGRDRLPRLRGALLARRGWRARVADFFERLRADATLASPVGRHAIRLAIVVVVAEAIALRTPLERGYWVALTAAIVLRPDFSTTLGRGLARTVGTSLGVLLAGLLAIALHPSTLAVVIAIGLLSLGCCATFQVSYVLFTALLTGLVVLLVGIITPGTFSTALARLLDTVIGGALALTTYALWPTWSTTTAPRAFSALLDAQAAYLSATLAMWAGRAERDPRALTPLSRAARRARNEAEGVVTRAFTEPSGRRLDLKQSQALLAAISRISLTVHSLRAALEHPLLAVSVPEMTPLGDALSAALAQLATRVRAESTPGGPRRIGNRFGRQQGAGNDLALPPLRRLHHQLAVQLAGREELAPLLAHFDELVDATDTLGAILGARPPSAETLAVG
ncbi:MAG: FUSC family protein [Actinomycetota bacterium]|nr:FUSC family protein [Actinomycetota bacterium]